MGGGESAMLNVFFLLNSIRCLTVVHSEVRATQEREWYLSMFSPALAPKCSKGLCQEKRPGCTIVSRVQCVSVSCCSVAQSYLTLCDPMDCSTPGFPVLHYLMEFAQTHVHWVRDAVQTSHPLLSPSPSALNLLQHQGLFQWVGSSHQVAKILELQLWHQSFQWIFRVDFL